MNELPISTVKVNALNVTQVVEGEGLPLLMLHGWGANIRLVWPLAQKLIPLGYRVYLPDLPGFGETSPPPVAWTVFDYANFVLAYLDAHQLEKVCFFGHSFGGRLGLILGAEHPERIVKMALADSAGVRQPPSVLTRARQRAYKTVRNGLYRLGQKTLADNLRDWYAGKYGSTDYKNTSGVMRETFVKVVNEDLLPYAARAKVPTLLFWGDQDDDTPLSQGKLLEKTIPDAGLIVHEGAGHYSYLDRLSDTVRVMDYFFKHD